MCTRVPRSWPGDRGLRHPHQRETARYGGRKVPSSGLAPLGSGPGPGSSQCWPPSTPRLRREDPPTEQQVGPGVSTFVVAAETQWADKAAELLVDAQPQISGVPRLIPGQASASEWPDHYGIPGFDHRPHMARFDTHPHEEV